MTPGAATPKHVRLNEGLGADWFIAGRSTVLDCTNLNGIAPRRPMVDEVLRRGGAEVLVDNGAKRKTQLPWKAAIKRVEVSAAMFAKDTLAIGGCLIFGCAITFG